jgi:hypothetical protein
VDPSLSCSYATTLIRAAPFIRTELTKVDEIKFGSSTPVLGSVTARENNKQIYSLSTCHFLPLTREAFEH